MRVVKSIDKVIVFLFLLMIALLFLLTDWRDSWFLIVIAVAGLMGQVWLARHTVQWDKNIVERPYVSQTAVTQLIMLSEAGTRIASWNIYGKTGVVIGRDCTADNSVNINLNDAAYASMICAEHAVLNYSGENWYIEDISDKNGVSVEKSDGKKYKLSYGKPCKLDKGDIIHIALTRLQII